ncbi:HutD family protein [Aquamicrobium sp. LC103]|uniref:HutD/Ves family protein n=1 Tax=Aquamicrobium sp. LC103 TaxID=1120658 RepID=UPI00063E7CDC|nr:HutD family protein [Aquamicrobium sp. LC103]TKT80243.1 HutD family protein [Aquamicrobium sp. LC103]
MRIVRAARHKVMPWKNGGGETTEIVVSPPGAGLDDFDWRVSMARVADHGPFSVFPGIDRTLAVLDGEGIILDVEGQAPLGLTRPYAPVTFAADAPTIGRLISGPIIDLNVMSRRGRFTHSVEPLLVDERLELEIAEFDTLVVCVSGGFGIEADGFADRLGKNDVLFWEAKPGTLTLSPGDKPAVAMIVEVAARSE